MKTFRTSILIQAPAGRIFDLLTDLPRWPRWNTTVDRVEGSCSPGGRVTVHAKASPGRAFPLRVAELVPPHRMVWTGGMPLGLFTGTRTYSLTDQADGRVQFEMTETFTGPLAPLITRSIPDLQPSFDELASCLKTAAERP